MKSRFLASLIALASVLPASANAGATSPAVVDMPDTPLHSDNVHWVTNVHTGVGVGGKFATIDGKLYFFQTTARAGFFIPSGVGAGGVVALDASNPEMPVLAGHLPLPGMSQNEDVELSENRKLLLYSVDSRRPASVTLVGTPCSRTESTTRGTPVEELGTQIAKDPQNQAICSRRIGGMLVVVDIANPNAMTIKSVLPLPDSVGVREDGVVKGGPGHTASCVLDCNYVYVAGGRNRGVHVVDLRDPAAPKIIGTVTSPGGYDGNGYEPGTVHDVRSDKLGNVWIVGSGGSAMYAPIRNPLKPTLLAAVSKKDNARYNQLIHHGAERLDRNVVLIGEESFDTADCGASSKDGAKDGSFQTWKIDLKKKALLPLDEWASELATDYQAALAEGAGIACSSHWFDVNANKVVANGFYEQGVRFLSVANPKDIRQVGYWIPPAGAASQAQYVPGRPDLVYVSDFSRGLDVLRLDNGGKGARTVVAPVRAEWLKGYNGIAFVPRFRPDDEWGWACKTPA